MTEAASRNARLETRIAPDTLQLAKRAAEIEGRSLSDYVATALDAAARRTIEETHIIRLSAEGQRAFVDMLLNSPPPNEALRRAQAHHRRLIGPA
ncbi:DUF1778 domain-containing protein [Methylobacterium sp. NEAU 140]|uniref:type II toxin-antitoxin system TacA family antitoxin n=1 Tax=Methylobacterium sp. NEAU 140 TaxID=3064945 RepID=UPI0027352FCB|nr:DUF1778 domain-containing protein [Methylobacterium sp. NEAU 140]MDP4026611.1 DUF1778 domain-containing protein [Methylobacterium sp. NEAU 140]